MEYQIDLFSLLGIGVSFIAFFLGLFFFILKKIKNDGYLFLYATILLLGFEMLYKTLIHTRLICSIPVFYIPGRFYNLLIYPVFLYFIWSVTKEDFRIKKNHILILLLVVSFSLYAFFSALVIPSIEKLEMLKLFYYDKRPGPFNYWLNPKTLIKSTIIPLLFLTIIAYDFFKFKRKNANIRSKRLIHITTVVIVLYFLYHQFSNLIYKWIYDYTDYSMIEWPVDITFLAIIIVLLSVMVLLVNTGSSFLPPPKYLGSPLEKSHYENLIIDARSQIEKNELFKKNKLTLIELSKILNTNPRYLSQAINHHLKLSFTDFINNYRIDEAKKQLLDKKNASLTLEAIGLMSGFKSKSAFFRAFKKETNSTPNQFMKSKKGLNS